MATCSANDCIVLERLSHREGQGFDIALTINIACAACAGLASAHGVDEIRALLGTGKVHVPNDHTCWSHRCGTVLHCSLPRCQAPWVPPVLEALRPRRAAAASSHNNHVPIKHAHNDLTIGTAHREPQRSHDFVCAIERHVHFHEADKANVHARGRRWIHWPVHVQRTGLRAPSVVEIHDELAD